MDEVALRLMLKSHILQQIWHAFLFMLVIVWVMGSEFCKT